MKKITYLFFIPFLIGNIGQLFGQDSTIHVYLVPDTVPWEEQICMPVYVNNFENIDGFQLSFNFDPYLLDYDSLANLNTDIGLNEGFFGLGETHLGIIRITFFDALISHTLLDSSILFEMCFTPHGNPDEICPISISDFPLPTEFISNLQNNTNYKTTDAWLDILSPQELQSFIKTCHTGISDTSGSLEVSVYGGNPPYFILWQHTFNTNFTGGFGLDTFGDSRVLQPLIEGRYRVTISDEDGTRFVDSINLRRANDLNYSTAIDHPTCVHSEDGSIVIDSIQGGIVPAQFKWSDGELFITNRTNLNAGLFQVTITQPLGCQILDTFLLKAESQVETSLSIVNESCLDTADGSFHLILSKGSPFDSLGYQIIYNNDTSYEVSIRDIGLSAGIYPIQVSDSLGCIENIDVVVRSGLALGIDSFSTERINCFADSNAFIYLRPKNLSGIENLPYTFSWSGTDSAVVDSNSIFLSGLKQGTYSITVTNDDSPGCFWDTTIIFGQPSFLRVQTINILPASCIPDNDGEATISINGGTPDGDGKYLIIWPNGQDSTTAVGLYADTIMVNVIDAEGCQTIHEVIVPNSNPPSLIGSSTLNMRCDSQASGSILAIFSSPFGIDSYQWSTGDSTANIQNIIPGTYHCTVTDRKGCFDIFEIEAEPPIGPEITNFEIQNIRCPGDTNGQLKIEYTMGFNNITSITWNGEIGMDSIENLSSGGYIGVVHDEAGCTDSVATTLIEPEPIHTTYIISDDIDSQGIGFIETEVSGGWAPYTFHWSNGTITMDSILNDLISGFYYLELVDHESCVHLDTAFVGDVSNTNSIYQEVKISISPNPTSSELNLYIHPYSDDQRYDIEILDETGRIIRNKKLARNIEFYKMDVSTLQPGPYYLKIRGKHSIKAFIPFVRI